ncbi:MAG TPA: hypothetical protein VN176_03670 [Verrucomicrobiae bacterium]|nr:hypothetical protein [Verrucomicrobiae bacterium]
MNPAIHSPQWYRTIGAIDEAELQAALKVPSLSTTPLSSHLEFGSPPLTVACQTEQWWIQSAVIGSWPRMIDVTSLVFSKLKETPLESFGLVAHRHIDTDGADIKSVLAAALGELSLGLPISGKSTRSNISLSVVEQDYEATTSIQPSYLSERSVFILYRREYEVPKAPSGYVDLGAVLKVRSEQFLSGSSEIFTSIVAAVNARLAKGTTNE